MMRDTYTLHVPGGITISTAITALQLKAGTNYPLEILRLRLTQKGSVTSAQERFAFLRKTGAATVTIAVTDTNVVKHNSGAGTPTSDASLGTSATGFTGTSEGTDGAVLIDTGFNVINGFEWLGVPEERFIVPVSGIVAIKFLTAPASQLWFPAITYRELG